MTRFYITGLMTPRRRGSRRLVADFSRAFYEVVTLITGFFPHAKPSSSSSSVESFPWMDICGPSSSCDPCIFLSLFDKLSLLSKEVNKKFRKAPDEEKMSAALPRWGDIYCPGDWPDFKRHLKRTRVSRGYLTNPCLHLVTLPYLSTTPLS